MRKVGLHAFLSFTLSSCASMTAEFRPVVLTAAIKATSCEPTQVTPLRSIAFEVQGCGTITYWICHYDGADRCCERVVDKAQALKPIQMLRGNNRFCEKDGDEVPLLSR